VVVEKHTFPHTNLSNFQIEAGVTRDLACETPPTYQHPRSAVARICSDPNP